MMWKFQRKCIAKILIIIILLLTTFFTFQKQITYSRFIKQKCPKPFFPLNKQYKCISLSNNTQKLSKCNNNQTQFLKTIYEYKDITLSEFQIQELKSLKWKFASWYQPIIKILRKSISQPLTIYIVNLYSKYTPYFLNKYFPIYTMVMTNKSLSQKNSKIYYKDNFASLYGGATIITKNSKQMHSVSSILDDSEDKYMYSDGNLPLQIVIGLNQQVAISEIVLKSTQMYSSVVKDFTVEGSFAVQGAKWINLGTFRAKNTYDEQIFPTQKKIIRYLRVTFLTLYGQWRYFTLTQIKVYGKALFTDAMTNITQQAKQQSIKNNTQQQKSQIKQICKNQFKQFISELKVYNHHDSNLILNLLKKVSILQEQNSNQNQKLYQLMKMLKQINNQHASKKQHYNENVYLYTIGTNILLFFILVLSLICICLQRDKELLTIRSRRIGIHDTKSERKLN